MVDRENRDKVISALRAYMDDKITAFEFDDKLCSISSQDETLKVQIDLLWYCYDDCTDHKIVAGKSEWDVFNRILLLLESDVELKEEKSEHWGYFQPLALLCFVCNALVIGLFMNNRCSLEFLFMTTLVLWCVSMPLSWWRNKAQNELFDSWDQAIVPFPDYRSLAATRRKHPAFSRRKYPVALRGRKIRPSDINLPDWFSAPFVWIARFCYLPFFFIKLAFPLFSQKIVVVNPGLTPSP